MPTQSHPLRDEVLQALRSLRHPAVLRDSPLLQNPSIRAGLTLPGPNPSPDDLAIALASRLEAIIQELRPEGEEDLRQRDWLQYYLLHYLFRRGSNPSTVLRILGISRSYLYQLRNEAANSVATLLAAVAAPAGAAPTSVVAPAEAPAAPTCLSLAEPIPSVPLFCGRAVELDLYRRQLQTNNLAILHGFAGTGKTALAAQLAAERCRAGIPVAWITFAQGVNTDLDSFLQVLACTLADMGFPAFREWLAAAIREPHLYPADTRIHYAVNCLVAAGVTLCLDDAHLVEDNPGLLRFFARLIPRQQPALLPLLVTSRSEPPFALGRCLAPLPGLNDADARALLHSCGLDWLDDDALAELQLHTDGNPVFLKFFAAWTQSSGLETLSPEQRDRRAHDFIAQLGQSPASRSLLLDEVIGSLGPAERSTLERIALCRKAVDLGSGAFVPLFSGLEADETNRALSRLERRNLLTCPSGTALYRPHGLVRRYMRTQLEQAPQRQVELHGVLAAYCRHVDDPLEAAYHLSRANRPDEAVDLLAGQAEELLQGGQAAGILTLAEEVPVRALTAEQRLSWHTVLAKAWQVVGNYDRAVEYLDQALEQLQGLDQALEQLQGPPLDRRYSLILEREQLYFWRGRRAEQARDLDELERLADALDDDERRTTVLLRRSNYFEITGDHAAAVTAAQAAVDMAQLTGSTSQEALGYWEWGRALYRQADYASARAKLEQALALARQTGNARLEADSLRVLGVVAHGLGEYDMVTWYFDQVLPVYRQLGDRMGESTALQNMGVAYREQGDYARARDYLEQALRCARDMGLREAEPVILFNLGNTYFKQGDEAQAQKYYEQSLAGSRETGHRWTESIALSYLGLMYQGQGNLGQAQSYIEQALDISRATGSLRTEAYALTHLGHTLQTQGRLPEAESAFQQAVEIRGRLGEFHLEAESLAGLAEVLLAQGKEEQALAIVDKILAYLEKGVLYSTDNPSQIYLACYKVLHTRADPRADKILATAYTRLQQQLAGVHDEETRRSLLENVPANRELMQLWLGRK